MHGENLKLTDSVCVTIIAFPQQQWSQEHASIL